MNSGCFFRLACPCLKTNDLIGWPVSVMLNIIAVLFLGVKETGNTVDPCLSSSYLSDDTPAIPPILLKYASSIRTFYTVV